MHSHAPPPARDRATAARRLVLMSASLLAGAAGCVEPFGGSNLQVTFSRSTEPAGGDDYAGARAPADTYFTFYAVDHVYAVDADGNPVVNEAGEPVPAESFLFDVQHFELRPVVDLSSPCFIELEDTQFPGLHVTQYAHKVAETICARAGLAPDCFDNPLEPPAGATDGDQVDVLTAERRVELLSDLQAVLRAVVSSDTEVAGAPAFRYPEPAEDCAASGDAIPSPDCTDAAANAQRLAACRALWAANPDYYEGSDKVFTLPLNGRFFGMVDGVNPINEGFVGGATMFVDEVLGAADAYTVTWQFKDFDGDGEPDYPADFLAERAPAPLGVPYVTGRPELRTRGVINALLTNPVSPAVFADVGIFSGLGDDDVQF
jgi:hypothetical protein